MWTGKRKYPEDATLDQAQGGQGCRHCGKRHHQAERCCFKNAVCYRFHKMKQDKIQKMHTTKVQQVKSQSLNELNFGVSIKIIICNVSHNRLTIQLSINLEHLTS